MPPAARITDMHVCPMVTGVVPHVGGPILPPGCPTVLIGMLPAARATDMATCVGPPDVILMGSPTVLIGNMMAARMGDPTAHGGTIVLGCPTVMIGDVGMGSPVVVSPTPPLVLLAQAMSGASASGQDQAQASKYNPGAAATALAQGAQDAAPFVSTDGSSSSPPVSSSPDKTHWISIVLKDQDGRPVPDEMYHIELPDGSAADGTLDAKGSARVGGIDPGNCKVTFPNLDKDLWKKE
jgi:uncharacterized Zn-binding protein involved in type VI secretion